MSWPTVLPKFPKLSVSPPVCSEASSFSLRGSAVPTFFFSFSSLLNANNDHSFLRGSGHSGLTLLVHCCPHLWRMGLGSPGASLFPRVTCVPDLQPAFVSLAHALSCPLCHPSVQACRAGRGAHLNAPRPRSRHLEWVCRGSRVRRRGS